MDVRLEDRALTSDLVVVYGDVVDAQDWAAFEALFVPDARIDYRSAGGIAGNPAEVAAWMPVAMSVFTWTLHSVSNHRIEFTGSDTASGTLHMHARHGVMHEGEAEHMHVHGRYHDEYVRTSEGWRFAARREETLAFTGGAFAKIVAASVTA